MDELHALIYQTEVEGKPVTVISTPEGHGRCRLYGYEERAILVHYYSENRGIPGQKYNDSQAEIEAWAPLIAIEVTNPESARVWAEYFNGMADAMEKEVKRDG